MDESPSMGVQRIIHDTPTLAPTIPSGPETLSSSYTSPMGLHSHVNPLTPISIPSAPNHLPPGSQLQLDIVTGHLHGGGLDPNDDPSSDSKLPIHWNQYGPPLLSNHPNTHPADIGGLFTGYQSVGGAGGYPQLPTSLPLLGHAPHHPSAPPPHLAPPHLVPHMHAHQQHLPQQTQLHHRPQMEPAYHTADFSSSDSPQIPLPTVNSQLNLPNADALVSPPSSAMANVQRPFAGPFYSAGEQYPLQMNGFHGGSSMAMGAPSMGMGVPTMVGGVPGMMGSVPGLPGMGGVGVPTAAEYLQTLPSLQKYDPDAGQGYSSSESNIQLSAGW